MEKINGKPKIRIQTVILLAVLILLASGTLIYFVIIPFSRYYYINHLDYEVYGGMTDELRSSELYKDMESGRSFCFLGDSITEGTITEGIPWYQPLKPYIKGKISRLSHSGWKTGHLIKEKKKIPKADVYVVAVGINDILFYDEEYAPANSDEYVSLISQLTEELRKISPSAKIYYITPWPFWDFGDYCDKRAAEYRSALSGWCDTNNCTCIDAYPVIISVFEKDGSSKYMLNNFHPNSPEGIGLFSYAVLKAACGQD